MGGRALNGRPGEEVQGPEGIGMLLPDGTLTGNLAADPGRTIEVDHLLGANMSFRRVAIEAVGGIHVEYPGTCLREETDLALRVSGAGWRLVYTPRAVVDHVAGPYAKGKRFDLRCANYAQRNHVALLVRTLGRSSDIAGTARTAVDGVSRTAVTVAGLVVGLCVGATYARRERGDKHR